MSLEREAIAKVTQSHDERLEFYSVADVKLTEGSKPEILPGCHGRMDYKETGQAWWHMLVILAMWEA
jgi:hypothetical protein